MAAKHRIALGIKIAVAGVLMFVVPSSYVVSRGWPLWIAAVIGGLAFPVLPVGWHIVAERKRRRLAAAAKVPPKSKTSRAERYAFRSLVVAVAVIGPMIAVGRFDVVRGVIHHGAWFVPHARELPAAAVLSHVPGDAEAVVVFSSDNAGKVGIAGQVVVAFSGQQAMVASDFGRPGWEPHLQAFDAVRSKIPYFKFGPVEKVTHDGTLFVAASDGWKTRVGDGEGPNAELRAELARAPDDATVIFAMVPKASPDATSTRRVVGWATIAGDDVVIEARLEMVDAAAADTLITEGRAAWDGVLAKATPACHDASAALLAHASLTRDGARITVHGVLPRSSVSGLMGCVY